VYLRSESTNSYSQAQYLLSPGGHGYLFGKIMAMGKVSTSSSVYLMVSAYSPTSAYTYIFDATTHSFPIVPAQSLNPPKNEGYFPSGISAQDGGQVALGASYAGDDDVVGRTGMAMVYNVKDTAYPSPSPTVWPTRPGDMGVLQRIVPSDVSDGSTDWYELANSMSQLGNTLILSVASKSKVYVYTYSSDLGAYSQQQILSGNPENYDYFGESVLLMPSLLFIGSTQCCVGYQNDLGGGGAVFVFSRSTSNAFTPLQTLMTTDRQFGGWLGYSGNYLVAGTSSGSGIYFVYMYDASSSSFTQQQTLDSMRGYTPRFSLKGSALVTRSDSGALVFTLNTASKQFSQTQVLTSSGASISGPVAFDDTGSLLFALGNTGETGVYIYSKSSEGTFTSAQTLTGWCRDSSGNPAGNCDGSIAAKSTSLVVGALYANNYEGIVYLFKLQSSTNTYSLQQAISTHGSSLYPHVGSGALFGATVALDDHGCVLGASPQESSPNAANGAVYVFGSPKSRAPTPSPSPKPTHVFQIDRMVEYTR